MCNKTIKCQSNPNTRINKVALVFPPLWGVDLPYIALPSLTSFLRSKGIEVEQKDFNIEYYNETLNAKSLEKIERDIMLLMDRSDISQDHKSHLVTAKSLLSDVKENIDNAKIRLASFDDYSGVQEAQSCIKKAKYIVSSLYYPSSIESGEYISQYNQAHLSEIIKAATSKIDNIFRVYFEEKIDAWFSTKDFVAVGISVVGKSQVIPAFTLAHVIKRAYPNMPIIMGGALLDHMRKAVKQFHPIFSFVDYFVIGEGETSLVLLCKYLQGKGGIKEIPNLLYRNDTDDVIETFRHTEEINELPTPDYTDLPINLYRKSENLPLLASRGCYWGRCAFCNLCRNYVNTYRKRDLELVMNDIESLIRSHKLVYVDFSDLCFSPSRLEQMCEIMVRKEMAGKIKYTILAKFEKGFKADLLEKAYVTGLRCIAWGLESASKNVLYRIRKGISPEVAEQCLENSHACGIWNLVYILFGFPGETESDLKATTDFVIRNGEYIDLLSPSIFHLEGRTEIFRNPEKYGIKVQPVPDDYIGPYYNYCREDGSAVTVEGLLTDEMARFSNILDRKHYCRDNVDRIGNNYILRYLKNGLIGKQEIRSVIESETNKNLGPYNLSNYIDSVLASNSSKEFSFNLVRHP